jgi:hypothetical protein
MLRLDRAWTFLLCATIIRVLYNVWRMYVKGEFAGRGLVLQLLFVVWSYRSKTASYYLVFPVACRSAFHTHPRS